MAGHTTRTVRAGLENDMAYGSVVPPVYLSTNFAFESFGNKREYDYTRCGNPTRSILAEALADLEGGAGAVVTATGTAAITLALLTFVKPGQKVLAPCDCYGGTWRLLSTLAETRHLDVEFVSMTGTAAVSAITEQRPAVVFIETPSNPLLHVTDIRATAAAAKQVGAVVVADNTFLSPLGQQPLQLGCDIVLHSTTKYINGHSDVVGGAVVAKTAEDAERLAWWANVLGVTGSPFDSYLTLRGLRTLRARLNVHQSNARVLAETLAGRPEVSAVYYPGLPDSPDHKLATAQQQGYGGMVSFELAGGEAAVEAFLTGLKHFSLAESLGGVESLVAHPASMTHAAMDATAQAAAGVTPGLLRLSVGIEDADDLVGDVLAGLERAGAATETTATPVTRPASARAGTTATGAEIRPATPEGAAARAAAAATAATRTAAVC